MKLASFITGIALMGIATVGSIAPQPLTAALSPKAVAAEAKATEPTAQQKIELIAKNKGQIGGGDQLRRFFYGDLEPLSVQPGGAGMVVNLYNKANNVTFSYCATYDVVVAVKAGRVTQFAASEVK